MLAASDRQYYLNPSANRAERIEYAIRQQQLEVLRTCMYAELELFRELKAQRRGYLLN